MASSELDPADWTIEYSDEGVPRFVRGPNFKPSSNRDPVIPVAWSDIWIYPRDEVLAHAILDASCNDDGTPRNRVGFRRYIRNLLVQRYMTPKAQFQIGITNNDYYKKSAASLADEITELYFD